MLRDDRRIQPFMTRAKGKAKRGHMVGTGHNGDMKTWEDNEDPPDFYAIYRGKLNNHSFHLVDIMNEFGRCGGFDALTQRLSTHKPNIPIGNFIVIVPTLFKVYNGTNCYLFTSLIILSNVSIHSATRFIPRNTLISSFPKCTR